MITRSFVSRVAFAGFASLIGVFFALPMLWLVFAPFNSKPTLAARPSSPTLGNFREVFERDDVLPALRSSALLVAGTVAIVVAVGAPASYALSRIRFPGRDVFLYLLLLLSSVITGTAAIVPLFYLVFQLHLLDTFRGVCLALGLDGREHEIAMLALLHARRSLRPSRMRRESMRRLPACGAGHPRRHDPGPRTCAMTTLAGETPAPPPIPEPEPPVPGPDPWPDPIPDPVPPTP